MTTTDATQVAASFLHLIQRFVGTQPDALAQMKLQVENELTQARDAVARAEAQLKALEQLQELIDEAPDEPGERSTQLPLKPPPLRQAILLILRETDRTLWTRDELYAELVRRGWGPGGKTPRNTFVSRLSDLDHEGLIDRLGDGGIQLRQEEVTAM